jgi:Rrf2 family protein
MLELAARYGDPRPVRLTDVSDKHGIPPRFLVQILLDLKRAGLVTSTRGAAGGYMLARSPEEITFHDILRVVDPREPTVRQEDKLQATVFVHNVRTLWDRMVEAQHEILKKTTLADLVQAGQGLQYVI